MELKLKPIRKRLGLGQREAADLCGMPIRRYGSYERGENAMSLETACDIADAFGCTLDELAGREWPHPEYADARQEAVNEHFATFNDSARQTVYELVDSMSHDPRTRRA